MRWKRWRGLVGLLLVLLLFALADRFTLHLGWEQTTGNALFVLVMACAATAFNRWRRKRR
jgi:hypothetical protein